MPLDLVRQEEARGTGANADDVHVSLGVDGVLQSPACVVFGRGAFGDYVWRHHGEVSICLVLGFY